MLRTPGFAPYFRLFASSVLNGIVNPCLWKVLTVAVLLHYCRFCKNVFLVDILSELLTPFSVSHPF